MMTIFEIPRPKRRAEGHRSVIHCRSRPTGDFLQVEWIFRYMHKGSAVCTVHECATILILLLSAQSLPSLSSVLRSSNPTMAAYNVI